MLAKLPRLGKTVGTSGGVQDQQHLVGRPGHCPAAHTSHLLQLRHEVVLRVQAPRGVDDDLGNPVCLGRRERIEHHCRGIGSGALRHYVDTHAFSPALQLFDGCRAKGVGGDHDDAAPPPAGGGGELGHRRCLAGAVHAHHKDHMGNPARWGGGVLREKTAQTCLEPPQFAT